MFKITVSEEIREKCPQYRGIAVYAQVKNTAYDQGLWDEINQFTEQLRATESTESIKQQQAITATREAYRACGKDPSRYRPSAEALRRRLLRGLELYRIDTLVDLINLVSLRTGYSIGGFDADKIAKYYPVSGQTVTHYTIRKERGLPDGIPVIDEYAPMTHAARGGSPMTLISGDRELEMLARYEENLHLQALLENFKHESVLYVWLNTTSMITPNPCSWNDCTICLNSLIRTSPWNGSVEKEPSGKL